MIAKSIIGRGLPCDPRAGPSLVGTRPAPPPRPYLKKMCTFFTPGHSGVDVMPVASNLFKNPRPAPFIAERMQRGDYWIPKTSKHHVPPNYLNVRVSLSRLEK